MRIRKRAYKPEILLSITKSIYGQICIKPSRILEKLEYEVFDSKGHGSQDEAVFLDNMGVRLSQDEVENLITIIDRDSKGCLHNRTDKLEIEYKKELNRIRKILVKDKELLNQEKG